MLSFVTPLLMDNGVKVTDIDCISSFCTSSSSGLRPRRSDAVTWPTSTASTTSSNWPATMDREGTCSGTRCTTRTPPNLAPMEALRMTACVSGSLGIELYEDQNLLQEIIFPLC